MSAKYEALLTGMLLFCQLVSSKDEEVSTIAVQGASSLEALKGSQEGASFMGKGGEQQFGYQPNVHGSQPQTLFSGG